MLDFLQWPAMLASVLAAWLVASTQARRRNIGFWVFIGSTVLCLHKTEKLEEQGRDTA